MIVSVCVLSGLLRSAHRPFAFVEPGDKFVGRELFVSRQMEEIVLN